MAEKVKRKKSLGSQERVLVIYDRLLDGKTLYKQDMMDEFGIEDRTLQRDMKLIRKMIMEKNGYEGDDFDSEEYKGPNVVNNGGAFKIEPPIREAMTDAQAFTLLKMLMECRGLNKEEMHFYRDRLIDLCIQPAQKNKFKEIIQRELQGYKGPMHGQYLIEKVWGLQQAIMDKKVLYISYARGKKEPAEHYIVPVGLMYNEYYFYVIGYLKNTRRIEKNLTEKFPYVFRVDRIMGYRITDTPVRNNEVPYEKQTTEVEFRNRVQFMFGGELRRYTLEVDNASLEAALDRLPNAVIVSKGETDTLIKVEIYGEGIKMWINSQMGKVKIKEDKKALGKL